MMDLDQSTSSFHSAQDHSDLDIIFSFDAWTCKTKGLLSIQAYMFNLEDKLKLGSTWH